MADYTITLTELQIAALTKYQGAENIQRELQSIVDASVGHTVLSYQASLAKEALDAANAMKTQYETLKATNPAKAAEVDALLASAVQAPVEEEPLEP